MDNNITILLGVLLTTSEILPYIKQIKGNGILEAFINIIVEIVKFKLNLLNNQRNESNQSNEGNQRNEGNEEETEPLLKNNRLTEYNTFNENSLNQNLNFSSNLNENLKKEKEKENEDVNININSENVFIKLNTVSRINYV